MPKMACSAHTTGQPDCSNCRAVWRRYDRRRKAAIAAGTWQPSVPAAIVQQHIDTLLEARMTFRSIAAAARLPRLTVERVRAQSYVQGGTAAAILTVTPDQAGPGPELWASVGALALRVQALCAIGWPLAEQARRSGLSVRLLTNIAGRRQQRVALDTRDQICALFERLCGTPGPSALTASRARAKGYRPPLDLDEAADCPAEPATPDCEVDEVLVNRVLEGERAELNDAELIAAVQIGTGRRGMPLTEVAELLSLRFDHVKLLQAGQLPPARAKRAAKRREAVAA